MFTEFFRFCRLQPGNEKNTGFRCKGTEKMESVHEQIEVSGITRFIRIFHEKSKCCTPGKAISTQCLSFCMRRDIFL
jgi:hypothetical protein